MTNEVKEELIKGLTLRALVIGIALSISVATFMVIMDYTQPAGFSGTSYVAGAQAYSDSPTANKQPGPTQLFWVNGVWMFLITVLIFSVLPGRLRFSMQEFTVIFTMLIVTVPMVTAWHQVAYMGSMNAFQTVLLMEYLISPEYLAAVAGWYTPSGGYTADMHLYPAGPLGRPANVPMTVPWNIYMGPMVWNSLQVIFLGLGVLFIAAILRKQYVEMEELPFPNATIATTLIENTAGQSRMKIFSNKWLWIGFGAAQILVLPGYIYLLGIAGGFDTTAYQFAANYDFIIPNIPLALLWTAPWLLGLGTLMPTNLLISYFITWIVFIVGLVNIEWMTGMFTPPPEGATMRWYVTRAMTQIMPLKTINSTGLDAVGYGVFIAAALFPLYIHRQHVFTTIKSIWKKPPGDLEKKEVLPYKWLLIGAIVSFLAYIALFIPTPAQPTIWMAPIMLLFLVLWWIGGSRFIATAGAGGMWTGYDRPQFWGSPNQWLNRVWMAQIWGKPAEGGPASNAMYMFNMTMNQGYWAGRAANSMPMPILLDCFKIADSTKTRTRDIFIAAVIGLIIPVVVANPLNLWLHYNANWQGPAMGFYYTINDVMNVWPPRGTPFGWRGYWYSGYPRDEPWPDLEGVGTLITIGLIFGLACFWLRARYPKFIYTPLAIAFWAFDMSGEQWFLMLAIALAIRYIFIRTYGVLQYQEKIVPMAVGLILGGMLYVTIDWWYVWTALRIIP